MLLAVLATDAAVHTASAQTEAGPAVVESSKTQSFIPPARSPSWRRSSGRGAEPAAGCTFTSGEAESALVHATYACAGGEIASTCAIRTPRLPTRFARQIRAGREPRDGAGRSWTHCRAHPRA